MSNDNKFLHSWVKERSRGITMYVFLKTLPLTIVVSLSLIFYSVIRRTPNIRELFIYNTITVLFVAIAHASNWFKYEKKFKKLTGEKE